MSMFPTLFFFIFFLQSVFQISHCNKHDTHFFDICKPSRCNETSPEIRFPFRLDTSPADCGMPGMELTCSSSGNETLLTFPNLGSTKVQSIDYKQGEITIELGNSWPSCLLQNITMLNLTTVVYQPYTDQVSLLTCSKKFVPNISDQLTGPVSCLSNSSEFVYVVDAHEFIGKIPPGCTVLRSGIEILYNDDVKINRQLSKFEMIVNNFLLRRLVTFYWFRTNTINECMDCESKGTRCGYDLIRKEAFCKPHNLNVKIISAASVAGFVILLSIPAILFYLSKKSDRERKIRLKVEQFLTAYKVTKPTRYTFGELKKITKHFSNKLGQGGFGSVYKGELSNGLPVAVKMLERSKGAGEEFTNEVATIGRIHHVNIVRLLGFCSEGMRRALIYEFMPNNSLEKHVIIRKNSITLPLRMEKLLQITIGIARGIEYLHQGCHEQILHFDIKPHNILLDDNLNPKIADFGLAKLCAKDQSIITMTAARGTMGYIAPEVYSRNFGTVSYKSDVYSFGMLLLEIVVGKRGTDPEIENKSDEYFPELIYDQLVFGQQLQLEIQVSPREEEIAKKLITVAFWCVQWNPAARPSMTRVLHMLIGNLQNLQMPPKPFVSSFRA
ncbi:hypothetical protein LUZ60_012770 [Juncus effusus]|nr:hypothetical protein LUZ60_012770 [Juncus effusus]